jgi:agmatinase
VTEWQRPPSQNVSPRFAGIRTFMRLPHQTSAEGMDFAVIGAPLDAATTFRTGARFGPEAIRSMSVLLRPFNPALAVDVFENLRGADLGDSNVIPGYVEESYAMIESSVLEILTAGAVPVVLGGDHSVTLPELRAIHAVHGQVALVHFDAHADTRQDHMGKLYGHGTPFRRAAEEGLVNPARSIQIGLRGSLSTSLDVHGSEALGYAVLTTEKVLELGPREVGSRVHERVGQQPAFLTFDVDVVDPAFAPGTGTPTIGGPTSAQALALIRELQGLNLIGMDVVEVTPAYDIAGITALLAATTAFEFLSLVALSKAAARVRPAGLPIDGEPAETVRPTDPPTGRA